MKSVQSRKLKHRREVPTAVAALHIEICSREVYIEIKYDMYSLQLVILIKYCRMNEIYDHVRYYIEIKYDISSL